MSCVSKASGSGGADPRPRQPILTPSSGSVLCSRSLLEPLLGSSQPSRSTSLPPQRASRCPADERASRQPSASAVHSLDPQPSLSGTASTIILCGPPVGGSRDMGDSHTSSIPVSGGSSRDSSPACSSVNLSEHDCDAASDSVATAIAEQGVRRSMVLTAAVILTQQLAGPSVLYNYSATILGGAGVAESGLLVRWPVISAGNRATGS